MRTTKVAAVVALALLAAMLAVGVAWAAPGDTDPTLGASAELRKAVEPAGILVHERRLHRIGNAGSDPDGDGVGTRHPEHRATTPRPTTWRASSRRPATRSRDKSSTSPTSTC